MQDGRLDTEAECASIDSGERHRPRQSRGEDGSMRHAEFLATPAQTTTSQGTAPGARHVPMDFPRPILRHTPGGCKRRLTSTNEYARLQRTRSGGEPRRHVTFSEGPLPHRSASMIVNPSMAASFPATGLSYDMAIDLTSSPPNSPRCLSYQESMRNTEDVTELPTSSSAPPSEPSCPSTTRAQTRSERYSIEEARSSLSAPSGWNGSGSMDSGEACRGNFPQTVHRGSHHDTMHRYVNARRHSNSGINEGSRTARRYDGGQLEQGSDAYGAGSSVTERGLSAPSNRNGWYRGEQGEMDGLTLPRWQPDAEVSECPICGTAFSFWYRKHHCRKCGRVVCAACSPHRITIPRQFIVRPPESTVLPSSSSSTPAPPPIIDLTGDDPFSTSTINPALGGWRGSTTLQPLRPRPESQSPGIHPSAASRPSIHTLPLLHDGQRPFV